MDISVKRASQCPRGNKEREWQVKAIVKKI
jgi:hypothetical protein